MLIFLSLLNYKFKNNVKSLPCPEIAYLKFLSKTAFNITNVVQNKSNMEGKFV